jgi:acid phosphatase (class A)
MKYFAKSGAMFRPIVFAALVTGGGIECLAKEAAFNYIAAGELDPVMLLSPPPQANSLEQAADLETVRSVHRAAGSNDIAAATAETKLSVFRFAGVVGGYFVAGNLPKTAACFEKIQLDAVAVSGLGKVYFHRPRPYTVDASLANGKPEKSFSYPSSHSTESMVLAIVLADLLPERRDAILDLGRGIGWRRVQIARHYPTDVYAGRVLAQAIVQHMKTNAAFQKDIAEVKAEIIAAQANSRN